MSPLFETIHLDKNAEPCVMVIFGATGDLTSRKLIPALYNLSLEQQLPTHFACVGFARREKTHEQFRDEMQEAVATFSRVGSQDEKAWQAFSQKLFYHRSAFDDDEGYERLSHFLAELDKKFRTQGNRIYYFSTQPKSFPTIAEKLHKHHLISPPTDKKNNWSRVIIEKPFGHDYSSALELQNHLSHFLSEDQIYRIDHYLGKETVQNLLVFRFANSIFESLWNNHHIEKVDITVAESIGVGTRGNFFEGAGILRDIVQNHMMQLLCLVAMDPPVNLLASAIRNEKIKVLEAIRPIAIDDVVRGQYGPGYISGEAVRGYREEDYVDPQSITETYTSMRLFIDSWRWAGVPFHLQAGKRLPKQTTEIAITFKHAPGIMFLQKGKHTASNVLTIRIQPDEGISMKINCKVPGLGGPMQPVKMNFQYGSYFGAKPPEAYERLICDAMAGDNTLFTRSDEVLESWKLMTPILEQWQQTPLTHYEAGMYLS